MITDALTGLFVSTEAQRLNDARDGLDTLVEKLHQVEVDWQAILAARDLGELDVDTAATRLAALASSRAGLEDLADQQRAKVAECEAAEWRRQNAAEHAARMKVATSNLTSLRGRARDMQKAAAKIVQGLALTHEGWQELDGLAEKASLIHRHDAFDEAALQRLVREAARVAGLVRVLGLDDGEPVRTTMQSDGKGGWIPKPQPAEHIPALTDAIAAATADALAAYQRQIDMIGQPAPVVVDPVAEDPPEDPAIRQARVDRELARLRDQAGAARQGLDYPAPTVNKQGQTVTYRTPEQVTGDGVPWRPPSDGSPNNPNYRG